MRLLGQLQAAKVGSERNGEMLDYSRVVYGIHADTAGTPYCRFMARRHKQVLTGFLYRTLSMHSSQLSEPCCGLELQQHAGAGAGSGG